MSERKQNAIEAVIHAFGKSKSFSEENKRAFAENIINNLSISYTVGVQLAGQKKYYQELQEALKNAKTVMKNLYEKIEQGFDGMDIDAQAQQEIHERLGKDVNRYIFVDYIQTFERIANSQRLAKRKPGPNNRAARLIARMIAGQYYKQFGRFPAYTEKELRAVGKRDVAKDALKTTTYGRVCSVIEEFLCIKIPVSTQKDAVNFIKKKNNSRAKKI